MVESQRSSVVGKHVLSSITSLIDGQVANQGHWEIRLEDLCSLTGIPQVDAYCALYTNGERISGYLPEVFSPDSIHEMMALLEDFSDLDIEGIFIGAGAYLGHEESSELAALYYDTCTAMLACHKPQREEYLQMLERFKTSNRAFEVYTEYFFDIDGIATETIERFVDSRDFVFKELAKFTTRLRLDDLIQRHVLSYRELFDKLFYELTGEEVKSRQEASFDNFPSDELKALGMSRLPESREELRGHYKTLMKTYHPDVNPAGLELSKRINTAYAALIRRYEA